MLESPDQVNFFDPDINDCPYDAYKLLRDEAPLWQDPITGMFVMTRYEDIKTVLADVAVFTNAVGSAAGMTEKAVKPTQPEELRKWEQAADEERVLTEMYEKDGWVPVATLDALDPPTLVSLRNHFSGFYIFPVQGQQALDHQKGLLRFVQLGIAEG